MTLPTCLPRESDERPPGFVAPNLSPLGLRLLPHELARGVWALMADQPPKDNNGLIVGERAALVVDAGVTPDVGRQIQRVAAELTDVPVRYLVHTTHHGDHTFGATAFGPEVTVVTSRLNRAAMDDIDRERRIRAESMDGRPEVLDEVTRWRMPDVVFDRFTEIDLGGRTVQLWHFGPGNGPGDTIVVVPDARTAWTGNFLGPAGFPGMLLIGDPVGYLRSVLAMRATLDVATLVPGHGPLGPAEPGTSAFLAYLEVLADRVPAAVAAGTPVEALYDTVPGVEPPPGLPPRYRAVVRSLHHLNILLTYRWAQAALDR
ncbi:MBL fold metallo-hydrolase [Pseudonocardia kunmingensis]|uniref:Glyoxylase-like metal-dependent hydrolase (Beta-lactamase superfamily II) n=1 Tax=Pseudonocardia kunmingensis TaxID=630975 RepID=A0A543D4J5_9PSEU|nr:MBL fold metallo-hydrolase [Pseudonocardia kunmingensis]TQM04254.1 glyoxylase-like metal-dependent hydrolase (beta-lactamase superfamily II) [Pseudonocardia kunmingensis]